MTTLTLMKTDVEIRNLVQLPECYLKIIPSIAGVSEA